MNKFFIFYAFVFGALCMHAQTKVVHVIVALCDNQHQGIVPVPKKIGNGQDPDNNLYWGCGYGVKTFFSQQKEWKKIYAQKNFSDIILERIVFRHKNTEVYLIADAYDGAQIKAAITGFLNFAAGQNKQKMIVDSINIEFGGKAQLICYVGHNGLMDFNLDGFSVNTDTTKREVIILACASKNYFYDAIKSSGANPLLWTTHLMCPEAYILHAAIDSWVKNQSPLVLQERCAQTYHQYQKCGINGARKLLVTGF